MISGKFGPMIWDKSEAPFKSEVRVSRASLGKKYLWAWVGKTWLVHVMKCIVHTFCQSSREGCYLIIRVASLSKELPPGMLLPPLIETPRASPVHAPLDPGRGKGVGASKSLHILLILLAYYLRTQVLNPGCTLESPEIKKQIHRFPILSPDLVVAESLGWWPGSSVLKESSIDHCDSSLS